jgi:hypothetical protein
MKDCNCVCCRAVRAMKRFKIVRKLYEEDELERES